MENEIIVDKKELLTAVQNMMNERQRFATATCLDLGDQFEVIYSFEPKDSVLTFKNIRVKLPKDEALPSISGIYGAAVVAENEICGDFNIQITGIPLDFQRKMLHTGDSLQFPLTKTPPTPKIKEQEVKPQKS